MHPLLRNATFVRLFVGRLVSNAGDSIYFVAATWLVYELTGSTFFTGLASSLVMLPAILQFAVGPIVDDVSVRTLLVATQASQMLLVLTIPVAAAFDALTVGLVLVIIPLAKLLNQFTHPAQSSALARAVDADNPNPSTSATTPVSNPNSVDRNSS
jgi:hypothetical protein